MTPIPTARLAFLTQPEPGTFILNLQMDTDQPRIIEATASGQTFERVKLTPSQVALIVSDGAQMGLRR